MSGSDESFHAMIDAREKVQNLVNIIPDKSPSYYVDIAKTRADNSCSLEEFIGVVASLVTKTMEKKCVQFNPDEGAKPMNDPTEKLEGARITYRVLDRAPKGELKPRVRQIINESTDRASSRFVELYGQRFSCKVQFDIYATEYSTANRVMSEMEDLLTKYSGYIKKQGVAELYFVRQFTDSDLDIFRQSMSIRSIQYHVDIERITAIFDGEITDITIT